MNLSRAKGVYMVQEKTIIYYHLANSAAILDYTVL